ncbi:MAG: hypothetical protein HY722_09325 [Planctomycetes bacterium]|nr:hypothetical protein [Planctomycetota bacterium]
MTPSLLAPFALAALALQSAPATIPVDEVRPGMRGHGLTVFQGTAIERFQVEVVDVIPNYFPSQDLILIRCAGHGLEESGIVSGMSGSPIYLEDRLAGALAYGWNFSRDPIAGVTPIDDMLRELERPRTRVGMALPDDPAAPGLSPVRSPLSFGGFAPSVVDAHRGLFDRFEILPFSGGAGGAGGAEDGPPPPLVPGAAVGVQLVRGDLDVTATGTVTWAGDGKVLAFGHPFFNGGECAFPMTSARVHLVLSRLSSSFKFASPVAPAGTVVQDRQTCILGDLGSSPDMLPVRLTVRNEGTGQDREFRLEVVRQAALSPGLIGMAVSNALTVTEAASSPATVELKLRVGLEGHAPVERTDRFFSLGGAAAFNLAPLFARILGNPFQEVRLDSVDLQVLVHPGRREARLARVSVLGDVPVRAGRPCRLVAELALFDGERRTVELELPVPEDAPGEVLRVEVTGGGQTTVDAPPPADLDDLLSFLGRDFHASQVVATVHRQNRFRVVLEGHLLRGLPPSAIGLLNPPHDTGSEADLDWFQVATEVPWVVQGAQSLALPVRRD